MKRLALFWDLVRRDNQIPDASFKKLAKFALGVSILFALAWYPPIYLVIALVSLAPYLVIFSMAFIISLLVCAVWFWWQEAGRLRAKGVDTLDEE